METVSKKTIEKPEIPLFVAEWIESQKEMYTRWDDFSKGDFVIRVANDLFNFGSCSFLEFDITQDISDYSLSNSYNFINAIMHGYRIEKEPLYKLKLADGRKMVRIGDAIDFIFDGYGEDKLTEKEIKSVDSRLFELAEKVD